MDGEAGNMIWASGATAASSDTPATPSNFQTSCSGTRRPARARGRESGTVGTLRLFLVSDLNLPRSSSCFLVFNTSRKSSREQKRKGFGPETTGRTGIKLSRCLSSLRICLAPSSFPLGALKLWPVLKILFSKPGDERGQTPTAVNTSERLCASHSRENAPDKYPPFGSKRSPLVGYL